MKKKAFISCISVTALLTLLLINSKANSYYIVQNYTDKYTMYGKYTYSITGSTNVYGCEDEIHGNQPVGTPVRVAGDGGGRNLGQAPNGKNYGMSGNSSSAYLEKPTNNAEIVKAYLVIESTQYDADNSAVLGNQPTRIIAPNGSQIETKPLKNRIYTTMPLGQSPEGYARISTYTTDVTDFVKANGYGYYQVWDIPYYPLSNKSFDQIASWKLLVITEDENTPMRMIKFNLGCRDTNVVALNGGLNVEINGNGIKTKETGQVTGQIVVGGAGGDPDQAGSRYGLQPSPNVPLYHLETYSKSRGIITNRSNTFFGGIMTHNGELFTSPSVVGYRNSDNLPFHNNDYILMDLNNSKNLYANGHNAYLVNDSPNVKISAVTDGTAGTLTVYGLSADISIATYGSSITHSGQAWQNIPLSMSTHLLNDTNTGKSNLGVSGGYATIKVDSNIKLDSNSVVAKFYDKSANQTITLPRNLISVNGNSIKVYYGTDTNAISQVGDTLDVSFEGTPIKTSNYTNTVDMYANGIVDELGNKYDLNDTMKMTSSKDTFSSKYNNPPTISATNKTFYEGEYTATNWKDTIRWQGVKASDKEDGTYTKNQIKIESDNVNVNKQGTYKVVYSVTDSVGQKATATSTVTVKYNNPPVISAKDRTFYEGQYTDTYWKNTLRWKDVSASDVEDGNITSKIQITADNVNVNKPGVYNVTYKVTDKFGKSATKTVKVTVKYNNPPTIKAEDRWFYVSEDVNETRLKEYVKAQDIEDGVYTDKARIKIISNNVRNHVIGDYKVTYKITDNYGKSAQTTANIHIVKDIPTGDEISTYLRFIDKKYLNTLKSNSLWRTTQSALLNNALNKTEDSQAKQHWHLSKEDIERIKRFNDTHDWSKESNKQFLEEFADLLQ